MLIDKSMRSSQYLSALPAFPLEATKVECLYHPSAFKQRIIQHIRQAKKRIYITALYWEKDEAGQEMLTEIMQAKKANPHLDIKIFVDWHRAQRNLLGKESGHTNADWYTECCTTFAEPLFFGVPINTREVFGVLHIKGFVFDDTVIYSGASLNNVYLQQCDKYRYDRYHQITQSDLADTMVAFLTHYFLQQNAVNPLDSTQRVKTKDIRGEIRVFRKNLAQNGTYALPSVSVSKNSLSITPLFGLGGQNNHLNQVIQHLFQVVQHKLTICTPYFNLPFSLQKRIKRLLKQGKHVEIIVGDKKANDFYIPPDKPFKMVGGLPYLYENNLRRFSKKFDAFVQNGQLMIRTWQDKDNSYHLKGIWADDRYLLLTGNNLNPRAWRLDAENGLLIRDPEGELQDQVQKELAYIRQHTTPLTSYQTLEELKDYPIPVQKLLRRFARTKADALIRMIL